MNLTLWQRAKLGAQILKGQLDVREGSLASSLLKGLWPSISGEPPKRQGKQFLDTYNQMPWARAPVGRIATSVAGLNWRRFYRQGKERDELGRQRIVRDRKLQRMDAAHRKSAIMQGVNQGDLKEVEDHILLDALSNGNVMLSGQACWKVSSIHMDSVGETFWIKERNGAGAPIAFWPIPNYWVIDTPSPTHRFYRVSFRAWQGLIPDSEIVWFKDPICVTFSLRSSLITASVTVYAMLRPSGETCTLPIDFASSLELTVSGTLTGPGAVITSGDPTLLIAGPLTIGGSAQFALTRQTVDVDTDGNGTPDLLGATLQGVALTVAGATVKVDGIATLKVSGQLALASVSVGGVNKYSALTMGNVTVTGDLDPALKTSLGLSASATIAALNSNSVATVGAKRLGWSSAFDLDGDGQYDDVLNPGSSLPTPVALPIDFASSLERRWFTLTGADKTATLGKTNSTWGSAPPPRTPALGPSGAGTR